MQLPAQIAGTASLMQQVLEGNASPKEIVEYVLNAILESTHSHMVVFWAYDEDDNQLVRGEWTARDTFIVPQQAITTQNCFDPAAHGSCLLSRIFPDGDSLYCEDTVGAALPQDLQGVLAMPGTRSYFCVPMAVGHRYHGVVCLHAKQQGSLTPPDRAATESLVRLLAVMMSLLHEEEEQRRLMGTVSHQTIGPLSGIMGYCSNLIAGVYSEGPRVELIYKILLSLAGRALLAAQNMLQMSESIQQGTGELLTTECDLVSLLVGVAQIYQGEAQLKELRISVDKEQCEIVSLDVNQPLFRQAISNIIDNAVKYSDKRTTIRVSCTLSSKWAKVTVRNRGIRLQGAELGQVFTRGLASRTRPAKERCPDGTGIGLWLVDRVMQLHGGKAIADPTDFKGYTCFHLCFPLTRVRKRTDRASGQRC